MTFTLKGLNYADCIATNPADGSTTITLPAGTNLSDLITEVKIDGVTVDASRISPNPTTTNLAYDELEVFVYDNKAYGFRFTEDVWFTAVFISDCHTNQNSGHDGTSQDNLATIMQNICKMGKDGTKKVSFTTEGATNLVPKTSIIFCLGDIDQDKGDDGSSGEHKKFLEATTEVAKNAGIPFIFIAGNHDLSPDYWDNGTDKGVTPEVHDMVEMEQAEPSAVIASDVLAGYFNLNGHYLGRDFAALRPGLYIVRLADGSSKKVLKR